MLGGLVGTLDATLLCRAADADEPCIGIAVCGFGGAAIDCRWRANCSPNDAVEFDLFIVDVIECDADFDAKVAFRCAGDAAGCRKLTSVTIKVLPLIGDAREPRSRRSAFARAAFRWH